MSPIPCSSATFEDKNKVSDWLGANLVVVPNEMRMVKLNHNILDYSDHVKDVYTPLLNYLESNKLYPTIIFNTQIPRTENRAEKFSSIMELNINQPDKLKEDFERILDRSNLTEQESKLMSCLVKGCAFHHSKLNSDIKEYIEDMFRKGEIRYLFSTTTLAYGVNFPAKSVVLYDLDFWDGRKNVPIPVHTFHQMAGRAGRSTIFANEGYSFIIVSKHEDIDRALHLINGSLESAQSQIINDDYFRKTILELIYAGRIKQTDIVDFFKNTYFNYLASQESYILTPFNLIDTIRPHAQYLINNAFIIPQGTSYKLSKIGQIIVEFLFQTYATYDLNDFIKINKYIEEKGVVTWDFDLIYCLTKILGNISLQKLPWKKSEVVNIFFNRFYKKEEREIDDAEYTAYAIYNGWIKNMDERDIESAYMVSTSNINRCAVELDNLLELYERLSVSKNMTIPNEFSSFRKQIKYGVNEDELIFKQKKGLGRDTCRALGSFGSRLKEKPFSYTGNLVEVLHKLYIKDGERTFSETLRSNIDIVGIGRSGKIIEVIKEFEDSQKK